MTIARKAGAVLALWHRRATARRSLRLVEAHRLADIGLDEESRRRECAKWFWRK